MYYPLCDWWDLDQFSDIVQKHRVPPHKTFWPSLSRFRGAWRSGRESEDDDNIMPVTSSESEEEGVPFHKHSSPVRQYCLCTRYQQHTYFMNCYVSKYCKNIHVNRQDDTIISTNLRFWTKNEDFEHKIKNTRQGIYFVIVLLKWIY